MTNSINYCWKCGEHLANYNAILNHQTCRVVETRPPRYLRDPRYTPAKFPIPFPLYVAPEPTPEQILNAKRLGIDPEDRIGIGRWWSLSANHPLAAAATIHDESYMYKLTQSERVAVDATFKTNCLILAEFAIEILELGEEYEIEAEVFPAIVFAAAPFIHTDIDRNTDVTRQQGAVFIKQADNYISKCVSKIGWGVALTGKSPYEPI